MWRRRAQQPVIMDSSNRRWSRQHWPTEFTGRRTQQAVSRRQLDTSLKGQPYVRDRSQYAAPRIPHKAAFTESSASSSLAPGKVNIFPIVSDISQRFRNTCNFLLDQMPGAFKENGCLGKMDVDTGFKMSLRNLRAAAASGCAVSIRADPSAEPAVA